MTKLVKVRRRRPMLSIAPKSKEKLHEKSLENEGLAEEVKERKEVIESLEGLIEEGGTFELNEYIYNEDGLFMIREDRRTTLPDKVKISDGVHVEEVVHNIDDKETYMVLAYKFNENYLKLKCGMEVLIPNQLEKLISKGVDIQPRFKKEISIFLNEQRRKCKCRYVYKDVGWHQDVNDKKSLVFRHNKIVTKDILQRAENDDELSAYELQPRGRLLSWRIMFGAHVKGNINAETLICIGATSILIGYLARKTNEIESLIVHLNGNSTQGKTTGAMLAVSLFGNPTNGEKGLTRSWNGTSNALVNSLAGNYGIPIVFDELSMNRDKELTSDIYVIANGIEKARLNDSISQRKRVQWATTIISTGEQSILERTNKNAGLSIRAIEFSNYQWTPSAENAEVIKQVCLRHYGVGVETIVRYIEDLGLERIQELIEKYKNKLENSLDENKYKNRIAKKLAIILATGEILKRSINLDLDLDGILDFLVQNERQNMLERDLGAKAFNQIVQVVIQNKGYFKLNNIATQNNICWGNINFRDNYYEVVILKNILEKNLRELGYGDPKIVVKEWKSNNYIDAEKDRSTKRIRIFNNEEQEIRKNSLEEKSLPKKHDDTAYVLKVPKEYLDEFLIDR